MGNEEIRQLMLAHGFKLKEQPDGRMDLNHYVYDAARALLAATQRDAMAVAEAVEAAISDALSRAMESDDGVAQYDLAAIVEAVPATTPEPVNQRLLAALKGVMPWVVTQEVACHGLKCRESVCMSCSYDSEESAQKAQDANAIAIAAIVEAEAAKTQTGNQKQLVDQDETGAMMNLANKIVESANPEEDSRLEVAYAIARHLGLDWPGAQQQDGTAAVQDRKQFEAEFQATISSYTSLERYPAPRDDYQEEIVQQCWVIWQAAMLSAAQKP